MKGLSVSVMMLSIMACTPALAASCNSAFGMASVADMDAFKADPLSLLNSNPNGGGALARSARALVLADTEFSDVMLSLGVAANADQRSAIGAGLGQAALACARTQPEAVQRMQAALISRGSPEIAQAFKAVTGDIPTTAVSVPATPSTPIGGTDASLIGGGQNEVPQGVAQRSVPTTLGFFNSAAIARTAQAARLSPIIIVGGNGSTGGGGTVGGGGTIGGGGSIGGGSGGGGTPVPTVPGPVVGVGLPALLFSLVSGLIYRRRRNRVSVA